MYPQRTCRLRPGSTLKRTPAASRSAYGADAISHHVMTVSKPAQPCSMLAWYSARSTSIALASQASGNLQKAPRLAETTGFHTVTLARRGCIRTHDSLRGNWSNRLKTPAPDQEAVKFCFFFFVSPPPIYPPRQGYLRLYADMSAAAGPRGGLPHALARIVFVGATGVSPRQGQGDGGRAMPIRRHAFLLVAVIRPIAGA